jgi:glycosyltransferase involved in cell wall biosynthesis
MAASHALNILFVCGHADRSGGADAYTESLATALARRGARVGVLCHRASELVHRWCAVTLLPKRDFSGLPLLWRIAPLLESLYLRRMVSRLATDRPAVIVSSLPTLNAALARRYPSVPLVYLPHSRIAPLEVEMSLAGTDPVLRWVATQVFRRAEFWSLRNADRVVRFQEENLREMAEYYSLSIDDRWLVMETTVPAGHPGCRGASDGPVKLLSVGRLVETKNVMTALRALAASRDLPWLLDVVGDGPDRGSLEAYSRQTGFAERVIFHGHQDDIGKFLTAADLFLFPSRLESYGLVVIEAMSYAVPTLAFRPDGRKFINANDRLIEENVSGFLVRDEMEFESRLAWLLANRDQLRRAGDGARTQYVVRHDWDRFVERWEALFLELQATGAAEIFDPAGP